MQRPVIKFLQLNRYTGYTNLVKTGSVKKLKMSKCSWKTDADKPKLQYIHRNDSCIMVILGNFGKLSNIAFFKANVKISFV